ncbi:MAG: sulfatase [Acidimicrobiales bacterium]|nr:sulfatase [Acidimicrobiales bacterium]
MSLDPDRPNILWVSFEDTNPFYGCYGDPVARTPVVDGFAEQSTRYPLAFSSAGVCAPARAAVITGMYPISIGAHHMRTTHTNPSVPELPTPYSVRLPAHVKCFTEYLRAAGWYCTNNDKTDYQFATPRTAWDDCSATAHWRNRPDGDQPFFAVFNPHNTHESGMWPGMLDEITFDPADMVVPPTFPDTPKVREALAQMYSQIEIADRYFGQLLAELEEDGRAENTLVVHWSDHGPLPRGKRWPYDSGIHIPMIVRWPGRVPAGEVSDRLVGTIDLGPSTLSACGLDLPRHMQGQAFLGDAAAPPREYVYASRDRHDTAYDRVRAVRDHRFKYLRNYYPQQPYVGWVPFRNAHPIMQELLRLHTVGELGDVPSQFLASERPVEELYDCAADPHEINNLAADPAHRDTLERLRTECDRWMAEVGDYGAIDESEMVARWYPDGVPEVSPPLFIAVTPTDPGRQPIETEAVLEGPALVQVHSGVQGASIECRLDQDPHWRIYAGPIPVPVGENRTIHARADRVGFKPSPEVSVRVSSVDATKPDTT